MSLAHEHLETNIQLVDQLTSQYVELGEGVGTMVHTAKYSRDVVQPKLVNFEQETYLARWCKDNNTPEALVGGFFLRDVGVPLGEVWQNGQQLASEPFAAPWNLLRGSIHITPNSVMIDHRHVLPKTPSGDLLQAGPLLVRDGQISASVLTDFEGFSRGSHQFDSDITIERHPRAAIGISDTAIWSVVCDGRTEVDAGMYLHEIAKYMKSLGCTHALNLDGGGSASLISGNQLVNTPRGIGHTLIAGRPIFSAIIFEPLR